MNARAAVAEAIVSSRLPSSFNSIPRFAALLDRDTVARA
jgi:hypothetical protein